jgi:glycosyltransferase involved in cell wall biosynthesis
MKVLLLGEYSGVHTDLAIALKKRGVHVVSANNGNAYRDFPRDFDLSVKSKSKLVRYGQILYKYYSLIRFIRKEKFDVIQLINPGIFPRQIEKIVYHFLFRAKAKKFLLACGDDDVIWDAYREGIFRYYVFTLQLKHDMAGQPVYWDDPKLRSISKKLREHVDAVVPLCIEYKMAYDRLFPKLPFIPLSIDTGKLNFRIEDKKYDEIIIFHGWAKGREGAKGTFLIREALSRIEAKFGERVKIVYSESLPFAQYKELLAKATIVVDQPNGYCPSMNALYAMYYGCATLSGNEPEYREVMNITEAPVINILPNADHIYQMVEALVLNPEKIEKIGREAHHFVREYHSVDQTVNKYLSVWKN